MSLAKPDTISVITVCYNGASYLETSLRSVLSQEYPALDHVVVDGGSTDGSLEIIKRYAALDARLRWISEPDRGISDAMNKGLSLATGEVAAFLHADDFYPDSGVLSLVAAQFAAQPELEWLTGGISYVDPAGAIVKSYSPRRWSYRRLLRGNIIFHPATFVRRRVLEEVGGFDTSLRYTMDYDLWLRLGRRSAPVLLDHPLACFRLHPGSTSVQQVDAAFREELQVRYRQLQGKPLQKALHGLYYWLKLVPNRMTVKG
ncbi:MAG: glycosyl transferase [Geobacteraceae bacterium GWC2_58_44]|nr:MAG: glycosyl transferase [Geobacteraceae bacterium GWC2_58_44]HBG06005.1 glycosyltransferase [Geobacter sp.]